MDQRDEVIRILTDLLAIAKVAMPDFLYAQDPRVHRARQMIESMSGVSVGRPPNVIPFPGEMIDLTAPRTLAEVEHMPGAEPPWDITLGLDVFMESDLAPPTRSEAVVMILRDWLIGHGCLAAPPGQEDTR
jgi:hypothetical protein